MSVRSVTFLASTAALLTANSALAQDDRYAALPPIEDEVVEAVAAAPAGSTMLEGDMALHPVEEIEWEETAAIEEMAEDLPSDADHHDADHHGVHHAPASLTNARPLGYSPEERESWLADCRLLYLGDSYYDYDGYGDDGDDTGLIGGLLGAVIGGIAGNRIADGERLAGTLIGAGVGGIAGLAIGTIIGSGGDDDDRARDAHAREEAWAADYCEAYLRRYESGGYATAGYVQAQPVMLVQVAQPRQRYREIVREEWVDVPVEETVSPARRSIAPRRAPAPQSTKLEPIK